MNVKSRWVVFVSTVLLLTFIVVFFTYRQSLVFDLHAISQIFLQNGGFFFPLGILIYVIFVIVSVLYGLLWLLVFFNFGVIFLASFGKAEQIRVNRDELPKISIVIAALDEENVIERTLKHLVQVDYPKEKMEILVVTSGSTDRTEEICRGFQEVTIVNDPVEKKGKPAALNLALKKIKGDVLVLYDADTIIPSESLIPLVSVLSDPRYETVVGPVNVWNQKNSFTKAVALEYTMFSGRGLLFHIKQKLGRHPMYMGSNCAILKKTIEELGGFSEEELTEDIVIGFELRKRKKIVGYAPEAFVKEMVPVNWNLYKKQRTRWAGGFYKVYEEYKKYLGPISGISMMTHVQLPLFVIAIPLFALIISLISMGIGIPLNLFVMTTPLPIVLTLYPFEQIFLNTNSIIFFSLDWMVITFSAIGLIFIFGLFINCIRKYGEKKYSLLKYLPIYIRNQWWNFKWEFKDKKTLLETTFEWEKTEKCDDD
ncbi:MAG: glycosyltransferase [Candidatus Helarchaeota archaeon]